MKKQNILGIFLLFITAIIWGASFVTSVKGLEILPPYVFNAYRYFFSFLFILCVALVFDYRSANRRANGADKPATAAGTEWRSALLGGGACGAFLFAASAFQQTGLQHTQATKAAFITTLYIVIVPVICVFLRKKVARVAWLAAAISVVGLYLLSIKEGLRIYPPDGLVFIGAFFWAAHIMSCGYFALKSDPLKLSTVQFLVTALCFVVFALLFEPLPTLDSLRSTLYYIIFSGPIACGIGFTFQIIAQRHTSETLASLILSTESVFAAVTGYFVLSEKLTPRELTGCILIFVAVLMTQIPWDRIAKTRTNFL